MNTAGWILFLWMWASTGVTLSGFSLKFKPQVDHGLTWHLLAPVIWPAICMIRFPMTLLFGAKR